MHLRSSIDNVTQISLQPPLATPQGKSKAATLPNTKFLMDSSIVGDTEVKNDQMK